MAKWARKNENNKIVELIDFDPTGLFHPDIIWESVADSTTMEDDNGITPEVNQAAKEEEARKEAEYAALFKTVEE